MVSVVTEALAGDLRTTKMLLRDVCLPLNRTLLKQRTERARIDLQTPVKAQKKFAVDLQGLKIAFRDFVVANLHQIELSVDQVQVDAKAAKIELKELKVESGHSNLGGREGTIPNPMAAKALALAQRLLQKAADGVSH